MAIPLVGEVELIEFIINHPLLELVLEGKRRKKPDIQKDGDRVRKITSVGTEKT